MICRLSLAATALVGGMLLAPQAGHAQQTIGDFTVAVTPGVTTDYLFRGISQTRGRPAAQLTLDVEHASGFYIGAFASNVAFAGTNARQELDLLAGYRFAVGDLKLDLGGIYYSYPGYDSNGGLELDYFEVALRGSYELDPVKFVAGAFYSPNFQAEARNSLYLEGGVDVRLPYEFVLSARLGHQWIDRNTRFGTPDFLNFGVSVSREVAAGFLLSVGYYGTDLGRADCVGGQKLCDDRFVATLTRPF
ncbi:MAG TPA: TorF family putative porin [Acetobacteraceae bacterium]|jgi:uncharacterized protein (TIGR02001 family)|nr:TorF family putative porin [Acetobacteraceae bacterium]